MRVVGVEPRKRSRSSALPDSTRCSETMRIVARVLSLKGQVLQLASRWLLALVVAASVPAAFATALPAEAPQRADAEFRQALAALDREPSASEVEVRSVAAKAGALLTLQGVKWTLAPDDTGVIIIAPLQGASLLNDLAFGLERNIAGLALRFDPRALKIENAGALYDEDAHQLLMSAQEVASGSISDYLAHEIVHAQNFHALSRGVDNIFMGWISSRQQAKPFHETYPHLFSIDELQAYARQARVNIRELHRKGAHGDVEGTIEMLDSGRQLALATVTAATGAIEELASVVAAGSGRQSFSELRTIDEEAVRVTGFETAGGRVYFYPWQLPSRIPAPPAVMRAVAESGDVNVDLILPKEFIPALAGQELDAFLQRARWLADRAEAMAANFVELKVLVANGDYGKAWERSRVLRTLSRRN